MATAWKISKAKHVATAFSGEGSFLAAGRGKEMVNGRAVRRDLLLAFEYAHNEGNWVFPLADALAAVTAQKALWSPDPNAPLQRCIWQIVLHMTVWTENIVERMAQRTRDEPMGHPHEGAWPPLPNPHDEVAWEAVAASGRGAVVLA